jgi:hypothetical protein
MQEDKMKKTKQTGIPIMIGGGFKINRPTQLRNYPVDRLTAFLAVDPKSEKEVAEFCNNYNFLPVDIFKKGIKKSFKLEQAKLKVVADKLFKDEELNDKELDMIDLYLGQIKLKVNYAISNYFVQINKSLGANTNIPENNDKKKYLTISKKHGGYYSVLWEEMITSFIERQDISSCKYCGRYFKKESKHNQLFCSSNCTSKYSKNVTGAKE